MSNAVRKEQRPVDWLSSLMARSVAAAQEQRRGIWSDSFYADEARAALVGAGAGAMPLESLLALALPGETDMLRYPRWQFEPAVLRQLDRILPLLEQLSSWNRHSFFTQHNELLGMSPLNALRAGQRDQVLEAATAANEDY